MYTAPRDSGNTRKLLHTSSMQAYAQCRARRRESSLGELLPCWLTEWSKAGRSSKLRRRGALRLDVQAAREAMALYGKLIGRAVLRSTTSHWRHRSSASLDQPSVVAQVRQRVRCRQGW
uniref:Uncharacterized protein n=1 Tax=Emiliania huxleyi TaxID=2903 RepID=A0A7S3WAW8_EMIHU|mmetsp:Transcript_14373/g.42603  ORF Transcript_14373/g.42603 Transcript_14373/m.42603 type:complete len:119 (-) Transcript_14373:95-451(-)